MLDETTPWLWKAEDLDELLGRTESLRLEFKSGRTISDKDNKQIAKTLTRELSAFANTEGGTLVIGIKESKSGEATALDGCDPNKMSAERLEQLLSANLCPYLPGLRLASIELDSDRRVFVVYVPQGTTAYQASDFIYYGRVETMAKALPDHEVRLRMAQGQVARVLLVAGQVGLMRSAESIRGQYTQQYLADRRAMAENVEGVELNLGDGVTEYLKSPPSVLDPDSVAGRWFFDEYQVALTLQNVGEKTVRDFEASLSVSCTAGCLATLKGTSPQPESGYDHDPEFSSTGEEVTFRGSDCLRARTAPAAFWPGRGLPLTDMTLLVSRDGTAREAGVRVRYKVYLDDAPPSHGELHIDFGVE